MVINVNTPVSVGSDTDSRVGTVVALSHWHYIAVRTDDGGLWLEVVFHRSAASWTRIVRLAPPTELAKLGALAEQIADNLDRTDVSDVEGALELCPTSWKVRKL